MPRRSAAVTSSRKSSIVPRSGLMAVWPPSGPPIAQGTPGSAGRALVALLPPLRKVRPIGWIGGR